MDCSLDTTAAPALGTVPVRENLTSRPAARFARLSVGQLVNLHQALMAISSMTTAFANAPALEAEANTAADAGCVLDDLSEDIFQRAEEVIDALRVKVGRTSFEAESRARCLIGYGAVFGDSLAVVAAEAAALAVPDRH